MTEQRILNKSLAKISKILKDNTFARRQLATSGRLEFNRLAKYGTSKKLFSTQSGIGGKKYNLYLLVDSSGSISSYSPKLIQMSKNIVKLLKHICHIDVELFNLGSMKMTADELLAAKDDVGLHFMNGQCLFKKIGDEYHLLESKKVFSYKDLIKQKEWIGGRDILEWTRESEEYPKNTGDYGSRGGGNYEVCNLIRAYNYLKQKEGTNIILVISDGEPNRASISSTYSSAPHLDRIYFCGIPISKVPTNKEYKQRCTKIGKEMELVGIGFRDDNAKQFYENFIRVEDPDQIFEYVVLLFQRLIKQGK